MHNKQPKSSNCILFNQHAYSLWKTKSPVDNFPPLKSALSSPANGSSPSRHLAWTVTAPNDGWALSLVSSFGLSSAALSSLANLSWTVGLSDLPLSPLSWAGRSPLSSPDLASALSLLGSYLSVAPLISLQTQFLRKVLAGHFGPALPPGSAHHAGGIPHGCCCSAHLLPAGAGFCEGTVLSVLTWITSTMEGQTENLTLETT